MDKVLDEGENGTIWTKENIGHSQTFGFELSATWQPIRMLSLGLSGDIYRDEIDGRTIGYDRKKSMVCGDIKGSVNISITPTTELHLRPVDPAGKDQAPFQCQCRYLPIFHAPQAACQPEHQQHLQRPRRNNNRRYERLANDPGPQP